MTELSAYYMINTILCALEYINKSLFSDIENLSRKKNFW